MDILQYDEKFNLIAKDEVRYKGIDNGFSVRNVHETTK